MACSRPVGLAVVEGLGTDPPEPCTDLHALLPPGALGGSGAMAWRLSGVLGDRGWWPEWSKGGGLGRERWGLDVLGRRCFKTWMKRGGAKEAGGLCLGTGGLLGRSGLGWEWSLSQWGWIQALGMWVQGPANWGLSDTGAEDPSKVRAPTLAGGGSNEEAGPWAPPGQSSPRRVRWDLWAYTEGGLSWFEKSLLIDGASKGSVSQETCEAGWVAPLPGGDCHWGDFCSEW